MIVPYLTFNGNCREAMRFYHECIGGELSFQTVGDSPMADQVPVEMATYILHATIVRDGLRLMASDMVGERGLVQGNAVSLLLNCTSEEDTRICYAKLAEGGRATHPLEDTFWGALFGGLTDRFGHHWLLHFENTTH